jgi:hypothetical protein
MSIVSNMQANKTFLKHFLNKAKRFFFNHFKFINFLEQEREEGGF